MSSAALPSKRIANYKPAKHEIFVTVKLHEIWQLLKVDDVKYNQAALKENKIYFLINDWTICWV